MIVVTFEIPFMTFIFISLVNCSFLKVIDPRLDTEKASTSLLSLKYDQGGLCLAVSTVWDGLLPSAVEAAHNVLS